MNGGPVITVIDLSCELLIDRSTLGDPYLRLLLTANGREIAKGSPWVVVNKDVAAQYGLSHLTAPHRSDVVVA